MITNGRVKELRPQLDSGRTLGDTARMAKVSEKTSRKYRDVDGLTSPHSSNRDHRTWTDPFAEVWHFVEQRQEVEPRLKAKTLFEWLQQTHEGQFPDSLAAHSSAVLTSGGVCMGLVKPAVLIRIIRQGGLRCCRFEGQATLLF